MKLDLCRNGSGRGERVGAPLVDEIRLDCWEDDAEEKDARWLGGGLSLIMYSRLFLGGELSISTCSVSS
jgi:hypothetical protein